MGLFLHYENYKHTLRCSVFNCICNFERDGADIVEPRRMLWGGGGSWERITRKNVVSSHFG